MELKFEELDNEKNEKNEKNEINYTNYWTNTTSVATQNSKKSKVSYDDILSSLNMVVNNGVLQFAKPIQKPVQKTTQKQGQKTTQQQQKQVTINNQQSSNNYITNKYFKDYKETVEVEVETKPMTKEEYKQMLIKDYINRQQAQRRVAQIKSKKLLFDTQHINISPAQMPRDMNKLFSTFSTFSTFRKG